MSRTLWSDSRSIQTLDDLFEGTIHVHKVTPDKVWIYKPNPNAKSGVTVVGVKPDQLKKYVGIAVDAPKGHFDPVGVVDPESYTGPHDLKPLSAHDQAQKKKEQGEKAAGLDPADVETPTKDQLAQQKKALEKEKEQKSEPEAKEPEAKEPEAKEPEASIHNKPVETSGELSAHPAVHDPELGASSHIHGGVNVDGDVNVSSTDPQKLHKFLHAIGHEHQSANVQQDPEGKHHVTFNLKSSAAQKDVPPASGAEVASHASEQGLLATHGGQTGNKEDEGHVAISGDDPKAIQQVLHNTGHENQIPKINQAGQDHYQVAFHAGASAAEKEDQFQQKATGQGYPVGHVSKRADGQYEKQQDGSWVKLPDKPGVTNPAALTQHGNDHGVSVAVDPHKSVQADADGPNPGEDSSKSKESEPENDSDSELTGTGHTPKAHPAIKTPLLKLAKKQGISVDHDTKTGNVALHCPSQSILHDFLKTAGLGHLSNEIVKASNGFYSIEVKKQKGTKKASDVEAESDVADAKPSEPDAAKPEPDSKKPEEADPVTGFIAPWKSEYPHQHFSVMASKGGFKLSVVDDEESEKSKTILPDILKKAGLDHLIPAIHQGVGGHSIQLSASDVEKLKTAATPVPQKDVEKEAKAAAAELEPLVSAVHVPDGFSFEAYGTEDGKVRLTVVWENGVQDAPPIPEVMAQVLHKAGLSQYVDHIKKSKLVHSVEIDPKDIQQKAASNTEVTPPAKDKETAQTASALFKDTKLVAAAKHLGVAIVHLPSGGVILTHVGVGASDAPLKDLLKAAELNPDDFADSFQYLAAGPSKGVSVTLPAQVSVSAVATAPVAPVADSEPVAQHHQVLDKLQSLAGPDVKLAFDPDKDPSTVQHVVAKSADYKQLWTLLSDVGFADSAIAIANKILADPQNPGHFYAKIPLDQHIPEKFSDGFEAEQYFSSTAFPNSLKFYGTSQHLHVTGGVNDIEDFLDKQGIYKLNSKISTKGYNNSSITLPVLLLKKQVPTTAVPPEEEEVSLSQVAAQLKQKTHGTNLNVDMLFGKALSGEPGLDDIRITLPSDKPISELEDFLKQQGLEDLIPKIIHGDVVHAVYVNPSDLDPKVQLLKNSSKKLTAVAEKHGWSIKASVDSKAGLLTLKGTGVSIAKALQAIGLDPADHGVDAAHEGFSMIQLDPAAVSQAVPPSEKEILPPIGTIPALSAQQAAEHLHHQPDFPAGYALAVHAGKLYFSPVADGDPEKDPENLAKFLHKFGIPIHPSEIQGISITFPYSKFHLPVTEAEVPNTLPIQGADGQVYHHAETANVAIAHLQKLAADHPYIQLSPMYGGKQIKIAVKTDSEQNIWKAEEKLYDFLVNTAHLTASDSKTHDGFVYATVDPKDVKIQAPIPIQPTPKMAEALTYYQDLAKQWGVSDKVSFGGSDPDYLTLKGDEQAIKGFVQGAGIAPDALKWVDGVGHIALAGLQLGAKDAKPSEPEETPHPKGILPEDVGAVAPLEAKDKISAKDWALQLGYQVKDGKFPWKGQNTAMVLVPGDEPVSKVHQFVKAVGIKAIQIKEGAIKHYALVLADDLKAATAAQAVQPYSHKLAQDAGVQIWHANPQSPELTLGSKSKDDLDGFLKKLGVEPAGESFQLGYHAAVQVNKATFDAALAGQAQAKKVVSDDKLPSALDLAQKHGIKVVKYKSGYHLFEDKNSGWKLSDFLDSIGSYAAIEKDPYGSFAWVSTDELEAKVPQPPPTVSDLAKEQGITVGGINADGTQTLSVPANIPAKVLDSFVAKTGIPVANAASSDIAHHVDVSSGDLAAHATAHSIPNKPTSLKDLAAAAGLQVFEGSHGKYTLTSSSKEELGVFVSAHNLLKGAAFALPKSAASGTYYVNIDKDALNAPAPTPTKPENWFATPMELLHAKGVTLFHEGGDISHLWVPMDAPPLDKYLDSIGVPYTKILDNYYEVSTPDLNSEVYSPPEVSFVYHDTEAGVGMEELFHKLFGSPLAGAKYWIDSKNNYAIKVPSHLIPHVQELLDAANETWGSGTGLYKDADYTLDTSGEEATFSIKPEVIDAIKPNMIDQKKTIGQLLGDAGISITKLGESSTDSAILKSNSADHLINLLDKHKISFVPDTHPNLSEYSVKVSNGDLYKLPEDSLSSEAFVDPTVLSVKAALINHGVHVGTSWKDGMTTLSMTPTRSAADLWSLLHALDIKPQSIIPKTNTHPALAYIQSEDLTKILSPNSPHPEHMMTQAEAIDHLNSLKVPHVTNESGNLEKGINAFVNPNDPEKVYLGGIASKEQLAQFLDEQGLSSYKDQIEPLGASCFHVPIDLVNIKKLTPDGTPKVILTKEPSPQPDALKKLAQEHGVHVAEPDADGDVKFVIPDGKAGDMYKFMEKIGADKSQFALQFLTHNGKKSPTVILKPKQFKHCGVFARINAHLNPNASVAAGDVKLDYEGQQFRLGCMASSGHTLDDQLKKLHQHLDDMGLSALKSKIVVDTANSTAHVDFTSDEAQSLWDSPLKEEVKLDTADEAPQVCTELKHFEDLASQKFPQVQASGFKAGFVALHSKDVGQLHEYLQKSGHGHLIGCETANYPTHGTHYISFYPKESAEKKACIVCTDPVKASDYLKTFMPEGWTNNFNKGDLSAILIPDPDNEDFVQLTISKDAGKHDASLVTMHQFLDKAGLAHLKTDIDSSSPTGHAVAVPISHIKTLPPMNQDSHGIAAYLKHVASKIKDFDFGGGGVNTILSVPLKQKKQLEALVKHLGVTAKFTDISANIPGVEDLCIAKVPNSALSYKLVPAVDSVEASQYLQLLLGPQNPTLSDGGVQVTKMGDQILVGVKKDQYLKLNTFLDKVGLGKHKFKSMPSFGSLASVKLNAHEINVPGQAADDTAVAIDYLSHLAQNQGVQKHIEIDSKEGHVILAPKASTSKSDFAGALHAIGFSDLAKKVAASGDVYEQIVPLKDVPVPAKVFDPSDVEEEPSEDEPKEAPSSKQTEKESAAVTLKKLGISISAVVDKDGDLTLNWPGHTNTELKKKLYELIPDLTDDDLFFGVSDVYINAEKLPQSDSTSEGKPLQAETDTAKPTSLADAYHLYGITASAPDKDGDVKLAVPEENKALLAKFLSKLNIKPIESHITPLGNIVHSKENSDGKVFDYVYVPHKSLQAVGKDQLGSLATKDLADILADYGITAGEYDSDGDTQLFASDPYKLSAFLHKVDSDHAVNAFPNSVGDGYKTTYINKSVLNSAKLSKFTDKAPPDLGDVAYHYQVHIGGLTGSNVTIHGATKDLEALVKDLHLSGSTYSQKSDGSPLIYNSHAAPYIVVSKDSLKNAKLPPLKPGPVKPVQAPGSVAAAASDAPNKPSLPPGKISVLELAKKKGIHFVKDSDGDGILVVPHQNDVGKLKDFAKKNKLYTTDSSSYYQYTHSVATKVPGMGHSAMGLYIPASKLKMLDEEGDDDSAKTIEQAAHDAGILVMAPASSWNKEMQLAIPEDVPNSTEILHNFMKAHGIHPDQPGSGNALYKHYLNTVVKDGMKLKTVSVTPESLLKPANLTASTLKIPTHISFADAATQKGFQLDYNPKNKAGYLKLSIDSKYKPALLAFLKQTGFHDVEPIAYKGATYAYLSSKTQYKSYNTKDLGHLTPKFTPMIAQAPVAAAHVTGSTGQSNPEASKTIAPTTVETMANQFGFAISSPSAAGQVMIQGPADELNNFLNATGLHKQFSLNASTGMSYVSLPKAALGKTITTAKAFSIIPKTVETVAQLAKSKGIEIDHYGNSIVFPVGTPDSDIKEFLKTAGIESETYIGKTSTKKFVTVSKEALGDLPGIKAAKLAAAKELEVTQYAMPKFPTPKNFTKVGSGNHLGGASEKHIYKDGTGKKYIFKVAMSKDGSKAKPFAAAAQAVFSQIAQQIKHTIPVQMVELDGKQGTVQPILDLDSAFKITKIAALNESEKEDIASEHLLDWLMSQHDSHADNFVKGSDGKIYKLFGIDKEQGFKYFPDDVLSEEYHPNAQYNEKEPVYNAFWRDWSKKDFEFDPKKLSKYVDKIEALDAHAYREIMRTYARAYMPDKPVEQMEFLQHAVNRKLTLRKDFESFITKLYRKRSGDDEGFFTFDEGWSGKEQVAPSVPQETHKPLSDLAKDLGFDIIPGPKMSVLSYPAAKGSVSDLHKFMMANGLEPYDGAEVVSTPDAHKIAVDTEHLKKPVPKKVKVKLTDLAKQFHIETYSYTDPTTQKSDPDKITLKLSKSANSDVLGNFLQKAGIESIVPKGVSGDKYGIWTGSTYHMTVVKKQEFEQAEMEKPIAEVQAGNLVTGPKVKPPSEKPKYFPAVVPHTTPQPNAHEFDTFHQSKIGLGKRFLSDGLMVEGNTVIAKKYIDAAGKEYYMFHFKLRKPTWQKFANGGDASTWKFHVADFNAGKDALVHKSNSSTSDNVVTRKWTKGSSELHLAHNPDKYSYMGGVFAKVYPEPGKAPGQILKELLDKVEPNLGKAILRNPTDEEREICKLSKLYAQIDPQGSDKLPESLRTVSELKSRLQSKGVLEGDLARVKEAEVLPGYHTHVEVGRYKRLAKNYGYRFAFQGICDTTAALSILQTGLRGILERNLQGCPCFGASYQSDVGTGAADGIPTRIVTDSGMSSTMSSHFAGGQYQAIIAPDELDRLDTYMHMDDSFGICKDTDSTWTERKPLEEAIKAQGESYRLGAELYFKKGVALNKIVRITTYDPSSRDALIQAAKTAGIQEVNGVPIDDYVVIAKTNKDAYEKYVKPLGLT